MKAVIQGDHILPVKIRLKYDDPKFIKNLYFPERLMYTHTYMCFLFPVISMTSLGEVFRASFKQVEPTAVG